MIREGERTDTIKLYVQLIDKVKRAEEISLGNLMLSTEFKNITNRQIKLMLEIQSLHHDTLTALQIQQIADRVAALREQRKTTPSEAKIYELLRLKVHSVALSRAIQDGSKEEIARQSAVLLQGITNLEQLRFIMQAMFRIRSLTALLAASPERLQEKYGAKKEGRRVLYVVALVKATASREEAGRILKVIGENANIIDEKKHLIVFLGAMVKKQQELLGRRAEDETFEKSVITIDKSTRRAIKSSIEGECKISISDNNPTETFAKINTLDVPIYLHAFPLTHLYFERNPDVIDTVRNTDLFKYLITSKSFIVVENMNNASFNSAHSRSKSKPRTKKNPSAHEDYLKASKASAKKCVAVCRKGLLLTKHNYGNMKFSTKFVRVGDQNVEYFKNSEATDSGTRWNFSEVLGVVYGKATPRQADNEEDHAETCFSVLMKDRSLDLSVESRERLPEMFAFMRGLAFLLGEYRQGEQTKAEEELLALKDAKKFKMREINEAVRFHEGKVQGLTLGGLLWSQLLLSVNSRVTAAHDGRTSKMQGMRRVSSRASAESLRR